MPSILSKGHKSVKHDIIDKTNSRTIATVAVATFILVFSLFAGRALISQSLYHTRVISEKEKSLKQLTDNEKAVKELEKSYTAFQSQATNIISGNSGGTGALDGTNAKIILDALPDKYDYPGLSSSFEKILRDGSYDIGSIGGTEDPTAATASSSNGEIVPTIIPYAFTVSSDVEGIRRLLETLEHSIRPMYVDNLQIQSGESILQTRVSLHTFFAQSKTFELGSKEVK
ncbi:hypothetical protein KBB49_01225 [Candidatus Saccharibacteria bacterium]|nr:hypothetical protein [Candidatus Saccharibacteria bacterium]